MLKYRHAFVVGLQSNLIYRWNFAVRSLFSLFHLAFIFIFWGAIYAAKPDIGGFGFASTLTYFIVLFLLQFFIGAFNEDYLIGEDIRNGLINQFLLKPINYFGYRLSVFAAARLVTGAFGIIALALALPFFGRYLVLPHDAWRYALGLPAMGLTALIQFSIAYCFGMLAFWFLEIQGFVILSMAVETVLGGQFFPLDLLPARVFHAISYLPFYYQAYFPNAILTGRIDLAAAVRGLGIQAVWAVLLVGLAEFTWSRGLRHHTAAGG